MDNRQNYNLDDRYLNGDVSWKEFATKVAKTTASNTGGASGCLTGAAIGSTLGAIGAVAGGIVGAFGGYFATKKTVNTAWRTEDHSQ